MVIKIYQSSHHLLCPNKRLKPQNIPIYNPTKHRKTTNHQIFLESNDEQTFKLNLKAYKTNKHIIL